MILNGSKNIKLHGYNEAEKAARTPQKTLASMPSKQKLRLSRTVARPERVRRGG
jgi:hypothetical protein